MTPLFCGFPCSSKVCSFSLQSFAKGKTFSSSSSTLGKYPESFSLLYFFFIMAMPLEPQVIEPPPSLTYSTSHSSFGHAGPLIAVLAIITILGLLAGVLGRLCTGRSVMGYRHYDWESWFERKFASCIDGRISPPPPPSPPPDVGGAGGSVPVEMPVETAESATTKRRGEC